VSEARQAGAREFPGRVVVTIVVDSAGTMSLMVRGPLKGKEGLLLLLDHARVMAEKMNRG
jgi:hypothetical protein